VYAAPDDDLARGTRVRNGRLVPLAVLALAGSVTAARADGLDGYLELTASRTDVSAEDASGAKIDDRVNAFTQRYSLNFARRLFPNLILKLGGLYEHEAVHDELGGAAFDSRRRRVLPYFLLTLRTGTHLAEIGYDRQDERFHNDLSTSQLVQETWRVNLGWDPVDLPRTRLEYVHRNTFDLDRRGLDVGQDRIQLTSRYLALEKVDLYYRGALEKDVDHLNDGELRTNSQNARVSYGDTWLDRRLTFSTDYTINYRTTESIRSGAGELIVEVIPTAGLSSLDDTPDHDALAANPALIDGNRTTSAGINLGLPPPAGDSRARDFGVDVGVPSEINTVLVWIDRELPPEIANKFSWRVYASSDNVDWTLRQIVPSAVFGPFENRFEVRFTGLSTRYLKLVVSPLAASVPDATSWPLIQVAELEPELRQPSSDLTASRSDTAQRLSADFRARLLDAPSLYYESSLFLSKQNQGSPLYTFSNGLSVSHALSPIFSGAARLAREDRRQPTGDQTAYLFSGSLTADPLPTVQESMVVSYVQEEGVEARDTASVVFSSVAQLYRGISGNLSLGRSVIRPGVGGHSLADDLTLGLTFVPHPKFTLNALVQNRTVRNRFADARPDRTDELKTAEIGAAYRPLRSLYLFASQRWERTSGELGRTLRNYALSWTPFPDGAFRFSIFYDSSYQTEIRETQQTLVPTIRWNITERMYIDLTYQDLRTTSLLGTSRTKVGTGSFRVAF
jgi:hypothetical protein